MAMPPRSRVVSVRVVADRLLGHEDEIRLSGRTRLVLVDATRPRER